MLKKPINNKASLGILILEIIDEYSNSIAKGLFKLSVIKDQIVVPIITNRGKGILISVVEIVPFALKKIQTSAVVSDGMISQINPTYDDLYFAVKPR